MMEKFQKLNSASKYLDKGLEKAAILCLGISVIGAVANVFLRYVLDLSYQVIEEICRYAIIYGAFLYVGPLIIKGEHLKMDFLQSILKGKTKAAIHLFNSFLVFASFVFLAWASIVWTMSLLSIKVTTVSGVMLMFYPALAIPIGMILGALYSLLQIIYYIYQLRFVKTTGIETPDDGNADYVHMDINVHEDGLKS